MLDRIVGDQVTQGRQWSKTGDWMIHNALQVAVAMRKVFLLSQKVGKDLSTQHSVMKAWLRRADVENPMLYH